MDAKYTPQLSDLLPNHTAYPSYRGGAWDPQVSPYEDLDKRRPGAPPGSYYRCHGAKVRFHSGLGFGNYHGIQRV